MTEEDPAGFDGIRVTCACTRTFHAPLSMKGGLANCPSCGKAVEVHGGPEGLFWILLGSGIAVSLVMGWGIWSVLGPTAGAVVLGVCALVIVVVVLAS